MRLRLLGLATWSGGLLLGPPLAEGAAIPLGLAAAAGFLGARAVSAGLGGLARLLGSKPSKPSPS